MTDLEAQVTYQLRNSQVYTWPFPHFFIPQAFPWDFFDDVIVKTLETLVDFVPSGFAHRQFGDPAAIPGLEFMLGAEFLKNVLAIFGREFRNTFAGRQVGFSSDLRLVRDGKAYKIGPHTDAPHKVVSLLFYLCGHSDHGTSIYLPNDPAFRCKGGPHHPFDAFTKAWTAPFFPNACFGFWKTDNSFHGVDPILDVNDDFQRDVLLYNIYRQ